MLNVLTEERPLLLLLLGTSRKYFRGPRGIGFLYARKNSSSSSSGKTMAAWEPAIIDIHGASWSSPNSYDLVESAVRYEQYEINCAAQVCMDDLVWLRNQYPRCACVCPLHVQSLLCANIRFVPVCWYHVSYIHWVENTAWNSEVTTCNKFLWKRPSDSCQLTIAVQYYPVRCRSRVDTLPHQVELSTYMMLCKFQSNVIQQLACWNWDWL